MELRCLHLVEQRRVTTQACALLSCEPPAQYAAHERDAASQETAQLSYGKKPAPRAEVDEWTVQLNTGCVAKVPGAREVKQTEKALVAPSSHRELMHHDGLGGRMFAVFAPY